MKYGKYEVREDILHDFKFLGVHLGQRLLIDFRVVKKQPRSIFCIPNLIKSETIKGKLS